MFLVLRSVTAFLVFLMLVGGWNISVSQARFEIATVEPFVLILVILMAASRSWAPGAYRRYVTWLNQGLEWLRGTKSRRVFPWFLGGMFFFCFLGHCARHLYFTTPLFDQGLVHQALFYPFQSGEWLHSTLAPKRSYLVDHFAPVLLLLTPITAILKSHFLVFALQAGVLAAGAWVLITRTSIQGRRSLYLLAAFLLLAQRGLRDPASWDFREDVFAFLFLSLALAELYRRRLGTFALAMAFYAFSKEHTGWVGLGIVFPILWDPELPIGDRRHRRLLAFAAALGLLAWNGVLFGWIIPKLQSGIPDASHVTERFAAFGNTPGEIIYNVLGSPKVLFHVFIDRLTERRTLFYLLFLLLPYAVIFRKNWPWLLACCFGIGINLASSNFNQRLLYYHYHLAYLPFWFVGILKGLGELDHKTARVNALNSMVIFLLCSLACSGRWPLYTLWGSWPSMNQLRDMQFLSSLPCGSRVVAADFWLLGPMSFCPEIRQLQLPDSCADSNQILAAMKSHDTSRIPGQSASDADFVIVNRGVECQRSLEAWLQKGGGKISGVSPSGSFATIEMPQAVKRMIGHE